MRTLQEVQAAFQPKGNLTEGQKQIMLRAQNGFKELAEQIVQEVPESADRTSALRKLLDAKMTCVQAITHGISPEEAKTKKSGK